MASIHLTAKVKYTNHRLTPHRFTVMTAIMFGRCIGMFFCTVSIMTAGCSYFTSERSTDVSNKNSTLKIYETWVKEQHQNTNEHSNIDSNTSSTQNNNVDHLQHDKINSNISCAKDSHLKYRKKIVFLSFSIKSRRDALDLGKIHLSYPSQLSSNLNSDEFFAIDNVNRILPKFRTSHELTATETLAIIKNFSQSRASQFLITGEILDSGFLPGEVSLINKFSLNTLNKKLNHQKSRGFSVKISLYDGFSGELIDTHIFAGQSYDRYSLQNKQKAFTEQFLATDYGRLIGQSIDEQSTWIENSIRCLPLRTRIVAHDANGVTLSSGIETYILPGDTFTIMAKSQHRQRFTEHITESFVPSGQVIVKSVYPNGAYAEFTKQSPKHRISKGDLVQSQ